MPKNQQYLSTGGEVTRKTYKFRLYFYNIPELILLITKYLEIW